MPKRTGTDVYRLDDRQTRGESIENVRHNRLYWRRVGRCLGRQNDLQKFERDSFRCLRSHFLPRFLRTGGMLPRHRQGPNIHYHELRTISLSVSVCWDNLAASGCCFQALRINIEDVIAHRMVACARRLRCLRKCIERRTFGSRHDFQEFERHGFRRFWMVRQTALPFSLATFLLQLLHLERAGGEMCAHAPMRSGHGINGALVA